MKTYSISVLESANSTTWTWWIITSTNGSLRTLATGHLVGAAMEPEATAVAEAAAAILVERGRLKGYRREQP